MTRSLNFNAGPATLPLPALERARDELLDFAGTGMSVMEQSHRGKEFEAVHEEAIGLIRELYGVGPDYDVLFLQGGASQLFATIPMNLLRQGASADYVVTGTWGEKAVAEGATVAKMAGAQVRQATPSLAPYTRAPRPDEMQFDPRAAYVHMTSNETIHGVQFQQFPDTGKVPLVCDMSSDFMWKKLDVSRFGLVYAGAQKNLGPSGVVITLIRKDLVAQCRDDIPRIFRFKTQEENNSLYNTPPTFAVYLVRNVLTWVKEQGGLDRLEADNRAKAERLYRVIDANAHLYEAPVEKESRSFMNVVFRLRGKTPEAGAALEERFLREAKSKRMMGLKGHRSVGGIRASIYNAVSPAWVEALADFMTEFAKTA